MYLHIVRIHRYSAVGLRKPVGAVSVFTTGNFRCQLRCQELSAIKHDPWKNDVENTYLNYWTDMDFFELN